MSTYEHDLLTARFAALAPRALPGDWDDVLERSGPFRPRRRRPARSLWRGGRRRKLVVALAVAVLVPAVAAAAYGTVRVLILDRGFIGLPPVGSDAQRAGERGTCPPLVGNKQNPQETPLERRIRALCRRLGLRRRANDLVAGWGGFPRARTSSCPATWSNDSHQRASSSCGRRSSGSSIPAALSSRLSRTTTIRGRARTSGLTLYVPEDYGSNWGRSAGTRRRPVRPPPVEAHRRHGQPRL